LKRSSKDGLLQREIGYWWNLLCKKSWTCLWTSLSNYWGCRRV